MIFYDEEHETLSLYRWDAYQVLLVQWLAKQLSLLLQVLSAR